MISTHRPVAPVINRHPHAPFSGCLVTGAPQGARVPPIDDGDSLHRT